MNQRTKTKTTKPAQSQTYCVEVKREQTFWCYVAAATMAAAAEVPVDQLLAAENRTHLRTEVWVANVRKMK